ncbi:hypothetical protein COCSUDRAFT_66769 [Coccomyxa subellipsoidea C-169]|uniref:Glycosyltransferase 61 catalytic domain-containing protein n=1 Tax=Coccomyxa subellipsoidea (strain C-169) TaxID=574566 RepID=I0YUA3_COCSC|nr:hypothetical protein COCSUDRAFT_66769 [Coccomyxa subellipsoidea C-169]EIE21972.1 hypothetical protein COCSUDRAFT_66769 [Coccomyxa subellipsoidea C-169]|eukprot:XP_005646516.1 hypothetical protein COCSUDRAFT_66769 [Coccomyxa subellipsoidea C-169]
MKLHRDGVWFDWGGANRGAGQRVGVANGVFPAGCKWRDVQHDGGEKDFWAVEEYEYWDEGKQVWTSKRPPACIVQGHAGSNEWETERLGSPRTEVNCTVTHCVYQNLWYNNGRFFLLVDGPDAVTGWKMTRNQDLNILHVDNATAFVDNLQWRMVTNDTLLFDFVYFLHPVHLLEWARAVIATTLGVLPSRALPPLLMQQEVDSVWDQILSPLEGFGRREWVCFERALVVRDMFLGGERTFLNQEDARAFRSMIYALYGLPPPTERPVPRVITFQRKRANRRVVNEEQLISLLKEFGEVHVVEFNSSTPFEEQLHTMAGTGVFVSVHTSNLANAPFLQPGSAVIEIIQRNWIWDNLDRSFQLQTARMGDIHHFAWRARFRNQTIYINKRDGERFGDWEPLQCSTEDCVEAHTNVDVVVNLDEFRALLESRLPLVYGGASVDEAALPWPPIE